LLSEKKKAEQFFLDFYQGSRSSMHQIACLPWSGRQARTACLLSKQGASLLIKSSESYLLIQQGFSLTIYA
jgi:hypothetical protein